MSAVFEDQRVDQIVLTSEVISLKAIAKNVADRFKPWKERFNSFFATNEIQDEVRADPIIKAHTQNKQLQGAYAALNSDIMSGGLVQHYKKHGDDYTGIDERLEDDLKATLTEYFDNRPEEVAKSGAYTRIKARLFKSPAYRQMITERGEIEIVADRSLDISASDIPILTDVIKKGDPDFYKANNGFNLTSAKEAVSSFLGKANEKVTMANALELAGGIAVGATFKVAFNSVAAATGVGLVAAVGYGVAKTTYDEYKNSETSLKDAFFNASGVTALKEAKADYKTKMDTSDATHGEAIKSVLSKMTGYGAAKEAFTAKRDEGKSITSSTFAFLKNINVHSSLKNSAAFAVGAAVGVGIGPDIVEQAPAAAVAPIIADLSFEAPVEIAEENQLTAAEMAIPSEFDDAKPVETAVVTETLVIDEPLEIVGDTVIPTAMEQLADLKEQNPALVEKALDGNKNAMKEVAYGLLNDKLGFEQNQELGAQLMKQAADMGHVGAMKDVAYLEAHTDLLDVVPVETELASLEVTGQATEILANALDGQAQAMNDAAIGLLNKDFGFPKDFDLGVEMLGNAVELGHEKSLTDMATLLEHKMVTVDLLSSEAQIKLLDHGTLQASDLTEKAHSQLTERINGEMQGKLAEGSDGVCSKTLDSCTFAESITEEKKGFIKSAFDAVKTQAQTVADLVTYNSGSKPTIVANLN